MVTNKIFQKYRKANKSVYPIPKIFLIKEFGANIKIIVINTCFYTYKGNVGI